MLTLVVGSLVVPPALSGGAPAPHPVAPRIQSIAVAVPAASPAQAQAQDLTQAEAQPQPSATARSQALAAAAASGRRLGALTGELSTQGFSLVGVTWKGSQPAGTDVSVRVRTHGVWGSWQPLETADSGPDPDSAEGRQALQGTEPLVTDSADGVQLRVESATGAVPADLKLALVDPGTSPADAAITSVPAGSAMAAAAQPTIISRQQWGADESMKRCSISYSSRFLGGTVHHTVDSNSYTDTAALIRSIYAYHTKSLGWCDIGYNFLVDRFGNIYEGRSGGITQAVIGAHTIGFNDETFGVAAIGNFDQPSGGVQPPSAMLAGIARIMAWKMGIHGIDPTGTAVFTSAGNSNYAAGVRVTKPTLGGHRDFWSTACPGSYLYAQLANLRNTVRSLMGAGPAPQPTPPPTPTPVKAAALQRLAGADRVETAIATSKRLFPSTGSAKAVVVANSMVYADGLSGGPLAASTLAPLLLTGPAAMDSRTLAEIRRVVPAGSTVYVLGGTGALSNNVSAAISAAGLNVQRLAGADRYGTAVAIAAAMEKRAAPKTVVLTSGTAFPDALSAGPAAAISGGVVLLTNGTRMPKATADFVAAHRSSVLYAVGGPAATAAPQVAAGNRIVGRDRYDTSALTAKAFGAKSVWLSFASGENFPDALGGDAFAGLVRGPLLLVRPTSVPPQISSFVAGRRGQLSGGYLFGGTGVVSDATSRALSASMG